MKFKMYNRGVLNAIEGSRTYDSQQLIGLNLSESINMSNSMANGIGQPLDGAQEGPALLNQRSELTISGNALDELPTINQPNTNQPEYTTDGSMVYLQQSTTEDENTLDDQKLPKSKIVKEKVVGESYLK